MSSESEKFKLGDLVYVAAGVAEVGLAVVHKPLQLLRAQLRRQDLADIAGEGQDDLKIRGELAIRRLRTEPHLELLAQRALARRAEEQNGNA
jgi:hypothetical protein